MSAPLPVKVVELPLHIVDVPVILTVCKLFMVTEPDTLLVTAGVHAPLTIQ